MERNDIYNYAENIVNSNEGNFINEESAIDKKLVGMRIFETPLMAVGKDNDEYFQKLKDSSVIGPHFMAPAEWLPSAKSVISFFFPFTGQVRKSNRLNTGLPSNEWLHARFEGQNFIVEFCRLMKQYIESAGLNAVIPSLDKRFKSGNPSNTDKTEQSHYTSNWSERHVAFVCGLGTFGLSRGLITKKGVAGRYASIITDSALEYDIRPYSEIYEYCTMCGVCALNCPAGAISKERGKMHPPCSDFLDKMKSIYNPRYGCGKCQVNVPCESLAPNTNK